MTRYSLIGFIFLQIFAFQHSIARAQDEINWQEEIDLLKSELTTRHPNLFFQTDSTRFYRSMDRVSKMSEGKSVFTVAVMLQHAIAALGDSHTQVNYHYHVAPRLILPLQFYWFEDGLYILSANREYESLLGHRLKRINSHPLPSVIDSLSTLVAGRNPSLVKNLIPRMITWTQVLKYFGFADTTGVDLLVEAMDGTQLSIQINLPAMPGEIVRVKPDSMPLGLQDTRIFFREQYFSQDRIYYIQYNKCWSREAEKRFGSGASALFMPSFKEFQGRVLQSLRKEEIDKLVLDLRYNGGGNSIQGARFIRKMRRTGIRKNTEMFLMIGRKTFSSAVINAIDFKNSFDPVIVGENSGGKPNHYGEVKRFVLPESNLVVNCSSKYFRLMENKDPPAIIPDIQTSFSYTDFLSGIDPAFEVVRRQTRK